MATLQAQDELSQLVTQVKTRINAGQTLTTITRELGISRYTLETMLFKAGWKLGRDLFPVQPVELSQEGK